MKKRFILFATVATLVFAMTACGTAQTSNTPTSIVEPTIEPTVEPEATSTPTLESEATSTTTPEPTATSEPTTESEATSTSTPESTPIEVHEVEDDGTLQIVVDELLVLDASERTTYLESKYGARYVVTVENNLDKLLPASLTLEQKDIANDAFLNAMDWCIYFTEEGSCGSRPTGEYYLTMLTDTVTGQETVLEFSIWLNLYEGYDFEVTNTVLKECNPQSFYEIFYYNVEECALGLDINADGVIGYNEALYELELPESTDDSNFEEIKNMVIEMMTDGNTGYSYQEFSSIIETMDESRYVVTAVKGLAPILKAELTDAERQAAVETFLSWPTFRSASVELEGKYGLYTDEIATTPTGEMYTMTITDIITGETIAWGFRVHVEADDKPGTYAVIEEGIGGFVIANMTADVADFYRFKY